MKKFRRILIIILIIILLVIPVEIDGKYVAVLWSRERNRVIVEDNLGGIDAHVRYYYEYKYRAFFFTFTTKDDLKTDTAQL